MQRGIGRRNDGAARKRRAALEVRHDAAGALDDRGAAEVGAGGAGILVGVDAGQHPPWLFGHSDGASIALLYARRQVHRVAGAVLLAPHIFVEDLSVASIARARKAYLETDLRARLGVNVLLVKSGGAGSDAAPSLPDAAREIRAGDRLVVFGREADVRTLQATG